MNMDVKGLQEMIKLLTEDRRKQEIAAERKHREELAVEHVRKEEELANGRTFKKRRRA